MHVFTSSLVVVALVLSVGCSSRSGMREQMQMTKACLQTRCDRRTSEASGYCDRCLSACTSASYDCNPSSACETSCGGHDVPCTDAERSECAETGFRAELPENIDSDLEAACNRARAHVAACGGQSVDAEACSLAAKVERSDLQSTYDCYANTPCDRGFSACEPKLTSFGDELCGVQKDSCSPFCEGAMKATLNMEGAWLRGDVQQAARDCVGQASCLDAHDCFKAWYTATVH